MDLKKFSNDELAEICERLNCWEWDNRLGEKPKDFDNLPNYFLSSHNSMLTKEDILLPIMAQIEKQIGKWKLDYLRHVSRGGMAKLKFYKWKISSGFQKFFGVGLYSSKNRKIMKEILTDISQCDIDRYNAKAYSDK
jgi:hypothetical protein